MKRHGARQRFLLGPFFLFFAAIFPVSVSAESGDGAEDGHGLVLCAEQMLARELLDEFNISVSHFSPSYAPISGIYSAEGRMGGKFSGLPTVFMFPTRLAGVCDWWPSRLVWLFGIEQQVPMSELTLSSWHADMVGITWNPTMEFRWQYSPNLFFGLEHNHWSGGAGVTIENYARVTQYAEENGIAVHVTTKDAISLQIGQQFRLRGGAVDARYRLGKNVFQASLAHIFSAFWTPDERRPYEFPWFIETRTVYHTGPAFDVVFTLDAELSQSHSPVMAEIAVKSFVLPFRVSEVELFYRWQGGNGIQDSALYIGRWGVWAPGYMTGITWRVDMSSLTAPFSPR